MGKIILITLLFLLAAPLSSTEALADRGKNEAEVKGRSHVEIEFEDEDEDELQVQANIGGVVQQPQKVEIKNEEFEIRGIITAVSGNTFMVAGQTVVVDLAKVSEFEQKGILEVGKFVKVEGVISNGTKFAEEINVIGTGQGRFQLKTEGVEEGANAKVEVKAVGTTDQIIAFLKQILLLFTSPTE